MKFINWIKQYEFNRFIFAGGLTTILSYLVYLSMINFELPYQLAYSISFISGIFISYLLNSFIVFRTSLTLKKTIRFPLVYIGQYFLGLSLLHIYVSQLSINKLIAPIFVVITLIPVSYFLTRYIVKGKI